MLAREVLQRVREIQIHTGRQVADVLAGQYVSVFKGRGIEFDEVRPYIPGDDVRTIDWNVTARAGRPYVKRYVEERQLTLMLMADVSASQDFGSAGRSKREATAELCALLAFSATNNDDKVGLTLFHGRIEQYIPARKGQGTPSASSAKCSPTAPGEPADRQVRRKTDPNTADRPRGRERAESAGGAGSAPRARRRWLPFGGRRGGEPAGRRPTLPAPMQFLMSVTTRKAVCFVVSDFLDEGFLPAMQNANRKHDVIAVLVTDPRELEMPNVGLVSLADAETGRIARVDTSSPSFRRQLALAAASRIERLKTRLQSSKIDFIHIDASGSVVDPLVKFFRMRQRRLRR